MERNNYFKIERNKSDRILVGLTEKGYNSLKIKDEGILELPDEITKCSLAAELPWTTIRKIILPVGCLDNLSGAFLWRFKFLEKIEVKPITCNCVSDNILFDKNKNKIIYYLQCDEKKEFTIPNCVKKIGDHAFYFCQNLESITLTESIEEIGNDAFSNCTALKSLTIPQKVKSIGCQIVLGCYDLREIKFLSKEPAKLSFNAFNGCIDELKIYIPSESREKYRNAQGWKDLPKEWWDKKILIY
ncbi:MAG: leucine-rich repeat domain-containing protein [Spirochaetia bacterium]|nr:leucine-rich repeat domain-containing protein [Spirochaetia bacterium]